MKKIIAVEGYRANWYFNFNKQTFIHSDKADFTDLSYFVKSDQIPFYVAQIALNEFDCSIEFLAKNLNVLFI